MLPNMSRYVRTFKDKGRDNDKNNRLVSFRKDDDKLLENYKTIRTKIDGLENIELNALPVYENRYKFQNRKIWRQSL